MEWQRECTGIVKQMRDGNLKVAEAAVVSLIEKEHSMRVDPLVIAVTLYEKMGDSEEARKHKEFLDGLTSELLAPGLGKSVDKPIEVLFVDEEYFTLFMMKLKMKSQALSEQNGHHFDILTTEAHGDQPEQTFYFNIDLHWNHLEASMGKLFEKSKEAQPKKK